MAEKHLTIFIDMPSSGMFVLELHRADGSMVYREEISYSGPVDNLLLTAIDNLTRRSRVDRFALETVVLGAGIDKSSSFYRIAQSFAAGIAAAR